LPARGSAAGLSSPLRPVNLGLLRLAAVVLLVRDVLVAGAASIPGGGSPMPQAAAGPAASSD
jgi:hypothetical protein